jgi:hypothetical protein
MANCAAKSRARGNRDRSSHGRRSGRVRGGSGARHRRRDPQPYGTPAGYPVIVVAAAAFAALFSLGGLMVSQVNQLATDLPRYQSTLREKIQNLRGAAAGTGTLERASEVLRELNTELDKPAILRPTRRVRALLTEPPDPRGNNAAEPWRLANARSPHHPVVATAYDYRDCGHLRNFYSHPKARFAKSAGAARRVAGSTTYNRGN